MKKLSLVLLAVLSLAAIGCKSKAGAGDCGAAVNHSMDLSKADMKKMGTDDKTMAKMVEVGVTRCKEDKWSADAIKCMTNAATMSDAQGCYSKLTADQQKKMNEAAMAVVMPSAPTGTGDGSAPAGDTGSATGDMAAGSAAAGSAAAGSAAAGSAAAGSAEAGSAGSAK
ncbi:MAG TPA: hypothetical protein VMZ53_02275 [Kofleriaceae bacterium]|nr:hypothetical protein [Kofleriaceae bacterium]